MNEINFIPATDSWTGPCPHCNREAAFHVNADFKNIMGKFTTIVCPACLKASLVHTRGGETEVFPNQTPPQVSGHLLETVKQDYEEALLCFYSGAFTASAIMCRRLIERSANEKGATGNKLYEKLDDLAKKAVLTKDLAKAANSVRIIGNKGAHPDILDLVGVTKKDAEKALKFVKLYTDYVYVLPAETSAVEEKPNKKTIDPEIKKV